MCVVLERLAFCNKSNFFSLRKNEQGKLDYQDLLKFVNIALDPLPPMPPISVRVSSYLRDKNNLLQSL